MARYDFEISQNKTHRILFVKNAFEESSSFKEVLEELKPTKLLCLIEKNIDLALPQLLEQANEFFTDLRIPFADSLLLDGEESCKNDDQLVQQIWKIIQDKHLDRHSVVITIGGGAFLDATGYAVALAHRGLQLIRMPTTTLSQADSGVGVKCAINHFGQKNWLGVFGVPQAVLIDQSFLITQPHHVKISGLVEAVKVALVKDAIFFDWLESNATSLAAGDIDLLAEAVKRSALLHVQHIAYGGDPFEQGSSRPLDFGHWIAHQLESISQHQLSHSDAVSIGMATDCRYASHMGWLSVASCSRIITLLEKLDLPTSHPLLVQRNSDNSLSIIEGLSRFREHLGGDLTLLMLSDIGQTLHIHEIDFEKLTLSLKA